MDGWHWCNVFQERIKNFKAEYNREPTVEERREIYDVVCEEADEEARFGDWL